MKKKKKINKKELLKRLKRAKVKESPLVKLKKKKDKSFRKEAYKESLVTSLDLNADIRLHTKKAKGTKGEIQALKNKIKVLRKDNAKIRAKRKQLEEEYVFSDEEGKKRIEKLLDKPDYKEKDLFTDLNLLKYFEGKDFEYVVNDGFEKYKIKSSEFKKIWKKGGDASLPILKKMKSDAEQSIIHYEKLISKEKKTASKPRMKKLKRILTGLKDKLKHVIDKNIEAIETGNTNVLDEYNEQGEKAYSLLFKVVGFSIDRIGI